MSFWTVVGIVICSFVLYCAIGLFINWVCACLNTYIYGDRDLDGSNWYLSSAFFWPVMWPGLLLFIFGCFILDVLNYNLPRVYIFRRESKVNNYNSMEIPTSIANYFRATYAHKNWPPQPIDQVGLSEFLKIDGWRMVDENTWTKFISKRSVRKFYLEG